MDRTLIISSKCKYRAANIVTGDKYGTIKIFNDHLNRYEDRLETWFCMKKELCATEVGTNYRKYKARKRNGFLPRWTGGKLFYFVKTASELYINQFVLCYWTRPETSFPWEIAFHECSVIQISKSAWPGQSFLLL